MPHRRVVAYLIRYWLRIAKAKWIIYPWELAVCYCITTRKIFGAIDPATVRVILGGASLGWAILALPWPWVNPPIFQRMGYDGLHSIAPVWLWSLAMLLHAIGVFWRFYGPTTVIWQTVVNGYGFCIWSFVTFMLNFGVGAVTPGTALEWCTCVAAFFCFVKDQGTPPPVEGVARELG